MAQLNIRIDDKLKEEGEKLFSTLGMSFSAAVSVFISQAIREGGLPFNVTTKTEPLFRESNIQKLCASINDMNKGNGIIRKTIEELEAMENE